MGGDINKIIRMRDAEIAEGMGRQAELGWFDVEFTMYGTAYLADDELCFRVSELPDHIYHYMACQSVNDRYFGKVLSLTERCPVPMGMQEEKALDVKKKLARTLRDAYPQELFKLLAQIAENARQDDAYGLLLNEQEELEGCFDEMKLRCFQELTAYCYSCLNLSRSHYEQFMDWLKKERKNMEEDSPSKDIFEKTFYGVVYCQNGLYHYLEDSLREYIYQRQYQLAEQGILTTPLYSETLCYNYTYRLPEARRDFIQHFHQVVNAAYLNKWQAVCKPNPSFSGSDLSALAADIRRRLGSWAADTFLRYAFQWRLLSKGADR